VVRLQVPKAAGGAWVETIDERINTVANNRAADSKTIC
jgi:hypothetical protein